VYVTRVLSWLLHYLDVRSVTTGLMGFTGYALGAKSKKAKARELAAAEARETSSPRSTSYFPWKSKSPKVATFNSADHLDDPLPPLQGTSTKLVRASLKLVRAVAPRKAQQDPVRTEVMDLYYPASPTGPNARKPMNELKFGWETPQRAPTGDACWDAAPANSPSALPPVVATLTFASTPQDDAVVIASVEASASSPAEAATAAANGGDI